MGSGAIDQSVVGRRANKSETRLGPIATEMIRNIDIFGPAANYDPGGVLSLNQHFSIELH